jgi:membrane peptidoglycan carboxypeptidase
MTFFGKDPKNLTVEESALLIGMVNKPTRYNPVINPEKALIRRNFVIGQMVKANYLTKEQSDSIQQIPISLSYQVQDNNAGIAPYFRDMLKKSDVCRENHVVRIMIREKTSPSIPHCGQMTLSMDGSTRT